MVQEWVKRQNCIISYINSSMGQNETSSSIPLQKWSSSSFDVCWKVSAFCSTNWKVLWYLTAASLSNPVTATNIPHLLAPPPPPPHRQQHLHSWIPITCKLSSDFAAGTSEVPGLGGGRGVHCHKVQKAVLLFHLLLCLPAAAAAAAAHGNTAGRNWPDAAHQDVFKVPLSCCGRRGYVCTTVQQSPSTPPLNHHHPT